MTQYDLSYKDPAGRHSTRRLPDLETAQREFAERSTALALSLTIVPPVEKLNTIPNTSREVYDTALDLSARSDHVLATLAAVISAPSNHHPHVHITLARLRTAIRAVLASS